MSQAKTKVKMENRITCGKCQQHMRPIWTLRAIHCPCCSNMIVMSRNNVSSQTTKHGNNQCSIFENFSNELRKVLPGTSSSGEASRVYSLAPEIILTGLANEHTRKRAVLIGVTYQKKKYKLKGTVNDVKNMKQLLIGTFGFQEDRIRTLTEEQDGQHIPTKKNILDALQWLVKDCKSGDSLVFFFSGHGLRQPDRNNDELDGFDETLCPVDFTTEGTIVDNEINSTIVRPLTAGVTLHAIVDACHSGTVLDLPNVYDHKEHKWTDNRPPSGAYKGTTGGRAICLSACSDDEVAADTSGLNGRLMSGAMTYSFIQAIQKKPAGLTYGGLLELMQVVIDEANKANCLNSPILSKVCNAKLLQEPVLSSTEIFDVNKKRFEL